MLGLARLTFRIPVPVEAVIEQVPPDHSRTHETHPRRIEETGEDYEGAKAAVDAALPDG